MFLNCENVGIFFIIIRVVRVVMLWRYVSLFLGDGKNFIFFNSKIDLIGLLLDRWFVNI